MRKFKCDILSDFQIMCLTVYVFRNIFNDILTIYFQTLFLIMLKLCRKKGPDPIKINAGVSLSSASFGLQYYYYCGVVVLLFCSNAATCFIDLLNASWRLLVLPFSLHWHSKMFKNRSFWQVYIVQTNWNVLPPQVSIYTNLIRNVTCVASKPCIVQLIIVKFLWAQISNALLSRLLKI